MLIFDQLRKGDSQLRTLAVVLLASLGILFLRLWQVQVFNRKTYQQSVETQSFRTVRVPALRGRIYDRNGTVLAENQPRYRFDLYLDDLRSDFADEFRRRKNALTAERLQNRPQPTLWQRFTRFFHRRKVTPLITTEEIGQIERQARYAVASNVVTDIGRQINQPLVIDEQRFFLHHRDKRALPLPVVHSATPLQVARFIERGDSLPGVSLEAHAIRSYPYTTTAAHLIGHLNRADEFEDLDGLSYDYRLPDYAGKYGLEATFDPELRGQAGMRSLLINSAGYRIRTLEEDSLPSKPGTNLVLTLDLGIQQTAEKSLAQVGAGVRGAVVVMDPRNGDLLALVSSPSFDPNWFVGTRDTNTWARYNDPHFRPMVNRATMGQYSPGSTFKIITSLALLENGLDPEEPFTVRADPSRPGRGCTYIGRRKIEDTASPGVYDFRRAFIKSSNSYFIEHGQIVRFPKVIGMAKQFHLGERTGIRVTQEETGDFPDLADERGWNPGQFADLCIGQQITVTPLQMAVMVSAVANGGKVFEPRVIDRLEPHEFQPSQSTTVRPGLLRNELNVKPANLERVRAAMLADVEDNAGTGVESRVKDFPVSGKTGTAEVKRGNTLIDKIVWFVSFAPFDNPRYVVIVMVESGGSGGRTAAPVAGRIYKYVHERELAAARAGVAGF